MNMRDLGSVLLCISLLLVATKSHAERVEGMSAQLYDRIGKVQELFEEEKWQQGLDSLQNISERRLSSYERAHVASMIGYAWYQLDDIGQAIKAYEKALAEDDLPFTQSRSLLTTMSQLLLVAENYAAAERYAIQLVELKGELPTEPAAWVILAQARVGQENYAGALQPLKTAIALERKRGKPPRENWLVLLSSVYFMTEDFPSMRTVLYELVSLYPAEQYLMNLAALHGQLGDLDKQLALIEALYDDQRLEQGNNLLSLANLFMSQGLPYKAATLLEREMGSGRIESNQRNLEFQSQAWYMAGEEDRSIPPLAAAAKIAQEAALFMRVARLHMDSYDWDAAEAAAAKAAAMSTGDELADALLLQGMAMAKANKLEPARQVFERAAAYEKTANWAQQWLAFIAGEQERLASFQP